MLFLRARKRSFLPIFSAAFSARAHDAFFMRIRLDELPICTRENARFGRCRA
ncbi:hypothetical protein C7S15_0346 [Burkholderia cepacia]|nr:hypothetical protein [Burkholderia cepacia]